MLLYTAKALGLELGLKAGEVEALRKQGVIQYEKGKLFALERAAASIIRYYRAKNHEETGVDYATERALLMRAKRLAEEYELKLREGSLHESEDVARVVGGMLLNFRARIMAVPAKLAPGLAKEESSAAIFKMLKEAMDDALSELSEYDRLFGENDEESDG